MNVFVLFSCAEGLPNVLSETMAVPCVTLDLVAARLLGNSGKVVPARNSQPLGQIVASLLDLSIAERQALVSEGQARAEVEFSMSVETK
jgi:glycosyltransferase involved in cell wall biosynthesis